MYTMISQPLPIEVFGNVRPVNRSVRNIINPDYLKKVKTTPYITFRTDTTEQNPEMIMD